MVLNGFLYTLFSIDSTVWIGHVCGELDQKTIPSSVRFQYILMHDGVYCARYIYTNVGLEMEQA